MTHPRPPSLHALRGKVTALQRSLLDEVWTHVKETHVGLPERPLLEKFGKVALHEAARQLGGTIVFSNHEENKLRYNLGLVGIFLTSDGPRLDMLVQRYLALLRDAYLANQDIERFSSKDLSAWAPDLTAAELNELREILYRAHGSLASGIGGWNAEEWFVKVDDEVVELKNVTDWRAYMEPRIMKWYDPAQPSGEVERMRYHDSRSRPDPIWDAIRRTDLLSGLHVIPPRSKNPVKASGARPPRQRATSSRLNLSFMKNDVPLRSILQADWKEAGNNYASKAWKSCVLLCGGVVEGLLLWQLEDVETAAAEGTTTKVEVRYDSEMLSVIVRRSRESGLIGDDEERLMTWARVFRNLIHPGNQRREKRLAQKSHAELALKLVQVVADGVRSKAKVRHSSQK